MPSRRSEHKGVEAIFTTEKRSSRRRVAVGLLGILAGISLWTTVALSSRPIGVFQPSSVASYPLVTLASLGTLFVTCGVGICVASWSRSDIETMAQNTLNVRIGLVALMQSLLLTVLYASLTQEYQSNLPMRQWVRSVFVAGDLVLNGWAVVLGSFLLGVLVVLSLTQGEFRA